jgi:hypothetical protein
VADEAHGSALWAVDNNLNLANSDWDDFAEAAAEHGVYRGFAR